MSVMRQQITNTIFQTVFFFTPTIKSKPTSRYLQKDSHFQVSTGNHLMPRKLLYVQCISCTLSTSNAILPAKRNSTNHLVPHHHREKSGAHSFVIYSFRVCLFNFLALIFNFHFVSGVCAVFGSARVAHKLSVFRIPR